MKSSVSAAVVNNLCVCETAELKNKQKIKTEEFLYHKGLSENRREEGRGREREKRREREIESKGERERVREGERDGERE